MENEQKRDNLFNNAETPVNAFKLDYSYQDISKNNDFQKWKNLMIKKYGREGVLFKCKKDNIYFYSTKEEYNSDPLCKCVCPCCSCAICYFCHRRISDNYGNGDCCLSRRIHCIFFKTV